MAKQQNGWQAQIADQRQTFGSRVRRAARRRALERGEADPIFRPFSKRLATEFQAAIDEFLRSRKDAAE